MSEVSLVNTIPFLPVRGVTSVVLSSPPESRSDCLKVDDESMDKGRSEGLHG